MKHRRTLLAVLLLSSLAAHSAGNSSATLLDRQWVAMGAKEKLEYKATPKGERIMDFSHAGYRRLRKARPLRCQESSWQRLSKD